MEEVKISNGPHAPRLYDGTSAATLNGDVITSPSNGDVFMRSDDDVVEILDAEKGPGDPNRETWGGKVATLSYLNKKSCDLIQIWIWVLLSPFRVHNFLTKAKKEVYSIQKYD